MKIYLPPVWACRFLRWYCNPAFVEDLEGDLAELYYARAEEVGRRKARWLYVRDVLLLLRPSIIRPLTSHKFSSQSIALFRNYARVSVRHLLKHRSYALLNVFGLSMGLAAALLLFLIVRYERSFDTFHTHYENIYQVREHSVKDESFRESSRTRTPAFPLMYQTYPEIVGGSRFDENRHKISYGDRMFTSSVHYVDTSFATTFDFRFLAGHPSQALRTPYHLVFTEAVAQKFFGQRDPIGQVIEVDQGEGHLVRFTVGAVVANPPANSSLQFEILIPWPNAPAGYGPDRDGNWYNTNTMTFIRLAPGANADELEKNLVPFHEKYYAKRQGATNRIALLPLSQLRSKDANNRTLVTLLSVIAAIILLVISFVKLSGLAVCGGPFNIK